MSFLLHITNPSEAAFKSPDYRAGFVLKSRHGLGSEGVEGGEGLGVREDLQRQGSEVVATLKGSGLGEVLFEGFGREGDWGRDHRSHRRNLMRVHRLHMLQTQGLMMSPQDSKAGFDPGVRGIIRAYSRHSSPHPDQQSLRRFDCFPPQLLSFFLSKSLPFDVLAMGKEATDPVSFSTEGEKRGGKRVGVGGFL